MTVFPASPRTSVIFWIATITGALACCTAGAALLMLAIGG